jgi:hypothetical protein
MTLAIYPDRTILKGLGFTQKWTPEFITMPSAVTASGAEVDIALAQYPLHTFELTYNFLRDGIGTWGWPAPDGLEFKALMGFWLQTGGPVGRFLYRNPDDCTVAAQLVGTGDGTTTTFGPIVRTLGAQGYGASEPVGMIDTSQPVIVRLGNNVQASSLYTLNTANPVNQTITFTSAPGASVPVYMDFAFTYYCKFSDTSATFEKFMSRLWMLQKVSLRSCRAGA